MSRIGEGTRGPREFLIWKTVWGKRSYVGRVKARDEHDAVTKFLGRQSPLAEKLKRGQLSAEDVEGGSHEHRADHRHGDAVEERDYTLVFVDWVGRQIQSEPFRGTRDEARTKIMRELPRRMKTDHLIYGGYARRESR